MLPGISLEQGRASKGHDERAQAGSDTRASAGAKAVLRALRLAWLRRVTGVVELFHSAPGARGRDRVPHTASAPHSRASAPRGKERGQGAAGTPARRHARAQTHPHTLPCPCTPTGLSSSCGILPCTPVLNAVNGDHKIRNIVGWKTESGNSRAIGNSRWKTESGRG